MTLWTCEQVREHLPDALAGTLRAEDAHALFAHAGGCADCRAEAELLQALRRHAEATPPGLEARIVAAVSARRVPWILRTGRPALLAAGLAGALFGGAVLLHRATSPRNAVPDLVPQASSPQAQAPAPAAGPGGITPTSAAPDVRGLAQPLPGTAEAGLFSSSGSTDDLSEEELQTLLKELQS